MREVGTAIVDIRTGQRPHRSTHIVHRRLGKLDRSCLHPGCRLDDHELLTRRTAVLECFT